jgi:hypothetical protein
MKYKCDWPGCTAKSETRFSYDANDEPIDAPAGLATGITLTAPFRVYRKMAGFARYTLLSLMRWRMAGRRQGLRIKPMPADETAGALA